MDYYSFIWLAVKLFAVFAIFVILRCIAWLFNLLVIMPAFDPLRTLPGPVAPFFKSHFSDVVDPDLSADNHEQWTRQYGKTFRIHGFGKHDYRLMSFDFQVINHVLNSAIYEKPWQTRSLLGNMLGRGVFTMEGSEHRLQRRIIGPAFSTQAIRDLSPIFFQKARELRAKWNDLISETEKENTPSVLDVSHWLCRAAFDAFGVAGLDYQFDAINGESETVYSSFRRMFDMADKKSIPYIFFPMLEKILPDEVSKVTNQCLKVIREAGHSLLARKKAVIHLGETQDKDILTLLLKSNLSTDDASQRLSDSDLLDQITSFLFAGSDSTAVAIAWCLHFLSVHQDIQERLRLEISTTECWDTYDGIAKLPLLDSVVRETLRLCPPVHGTVRVATKDDLIPVSQAIPLEKGPSLNSATHVKIRKGTWVHIPIEGLNYDKTIWGPDSREFRPDRWTSLPDAARPPLFPGLANVMSFSLGPHSCPGYKFTLTEMKAFLATLIHAFRFSSPPGQRVGKFNGILMRPFVKGQLDKGLRLPLVVQRVQEV